MLLFISFEERNLLAIYLDLLSNFIVGYRFDWLREGSGYIYFVQAENEQGTKMLDYSYMRYILDST